MKSTGKKTSAVGALERLQSSILEVLCGNSNDAPSNALRYEQSGKAGQCKYRLGLLKTRMLSVVLQGTT